MFKKKYNDSLFECLNWILKKTIKDLSSIQLPSSFIINRSLSMVDSSTAQIINATTNRWINKTESFREALFLSNFYRNLLPKHNNRINYFKRKQKEIKNKEEIDLSKQMQMSQREIDLYDQTLDEIKEFVK